MLHVKLGIKPATLRRQNNSQGSLTEKMISQLQELRGQLTADCIKMWTFTVNALWQTWGIFNQSSKLSSFWVSRSESTCVLCDCLSVLSRDRCRKVAPHCFNYSASLLRNHGLS